MCCIFVAMGLIGNVLKGVAYRLGAGKSGTDFIAIPWAKEKWLKHLPADNQERLLVLQNQHIHFSKPWEVLHTWDEIFCQQIYRFKTTNQSPYILDCGSNIGMAVMYFKWLYPQAIIQAFEPDASNYALLEKNVAGNHYSNVTLHKEAIWIHNDGIQFQSAGSHASRIGDDAGANTISVPTRRLKELLLERPVDFLKLDIEGAEYEVLLDCEDALHQVGHFFLEYHGTVGDTPKLTRLLNMMENAGFSCYIRNAADLLKHPFADKQLPGQPFEVQLNVFAYRIGQS